MAEEPATQGRNSPQREQHHMSEQATADATSTDTQDEVQATEPEQQETTSTEGESALGDAGKQALDRMKQERTAARAEAKAAKDALEALQAQLALKDKPAEEQAIEQAKAEARAEATTAANKRILRSELKALATGKLADPADAHLYINLDDFTVDDNGDVDSDALTDAITDLLEKKPHLAAAKQTRFDGDADQGAKGKESGASQLTQADLDRMKAAGDDDGIAAARAEGRFNKLLGL